jgi:hypothetical protein
VKYEAAVELVLSLAYAVTFHMMITLQIMIMNFVHVFLILVNYCLQLLLYTNG